jgi:YHS domain-containing protein
MTKQLIITAIGALLLTACTNTQPKTEDTAATDNAKTTETQASNGPKDPVCEMPKDKEWTEYTVNGTDTVWFCSETCKTAYLGNPAKYQANKGS